MADKKISALSSASTPLAGTEVLPIVQSGSTVKVAVSDLTAGRSVSASSLSLSTPLAVGSGGTGTATAFTAGSVVFAGASGVYSQSNANLFWDSANTRLGIGTNSPANTLSVAGTIRSTGTNGNIGATGTTGNATVALTSNAATWSIQTANSDAGLYFRDETAGAERGRWDTSGNFKVQSGNFVPGTAAKGVNFTANTPAAGMTSQLLNWYEEGTWTPNISDGTNNATTGVGTQGKYTRIGNTVHIWARVKLSSLGSVTGAVRLITLPFTAANNNSNYAPVNFGLAAGLSITANQVITGEVLVGSTYAELNIWSATGGTTALQATNLTNTSDLYLHCVYQAA